ncbi:MAG: amidohydrolase [Sedimentibacter saalensis]|uniref:amidohydrolase n=1 Tax=Sedimentibacter saalensis TaxID=130788 RepID=UPI003157FF20
MGYKKWVDELEMNYGETVQWRRHIHEYPEPSFEEKKTAEFIVSKLKEFKIDEIRTNVGNGYGIVAKIKGSKPGPTIAFRADIDALRLQEEADVMFSSKNPGIMHACGHDAHAATLLSVAKVLQNNRHELKGNLVLLFQPAEECPPGGAESMVKDGCLDGVDYVFGLHVMSNVEVGKIGYFSHFGSACSDTFNIKIQGKGGHGAMPHTTIDPVVIGANVVTQLQSLVSRYIDPLKPAVLTFAGFQAGGAADNIIADNAYLNGTVRTLNSEVRDLMEEQIKKMGNAIINSFGGKAEIEYRRGYPSVENTLEVTDHLKNILASKFGEKEVSELTVTMGGEDFAYYLQEKPGSFFYVGAGNDDINANFPHHHPKFKIDEKSMIYSGKSFLALAEYYLL